MRCSIAITTDRGRLARRFASECDGHHKNALFSTELKGSVNPLTRRPLQRFSLRRGMRGRKGDRSALQPGRLFFVLKNFSRVARAELTGSEPAA
jgi:hypothetical protein